MLRMARNRRLRVECTRAGVGIDFATRSFNGNSNDRFGNIGDWSVDLVVSEKTPQQAASSMVVFKNQGIHYIMKEMVTGQ